MHRYGNSVEHDTDFGRRLGGLPAGIFLVPGFSAEMDTGARSYVRNFVGSYGNNCLWGA